MLRKERFKQIVTILQGVRVQYMLTGALTACLQGEPRATVDMDFLLTLSKKEVPVFTAVFSREGFLLDKQEVEQAVVLKNCFVLIHRATGGRVNFWLLTNSPFDISRRMRSRQERLFGLMVAVSSPEDTILGALCWMTCFGGGEKQFMDALRVYEVQKPILDLDYLEDWAKRLGLFSQYLRLKEEAQVF